MKDPTNTQANLARVVAFARVNGFPNATELYWDENYPEAGWPDLGELMDDDNVDYRVRCGVDLNAPTMIARRDREDGADDAGEVYIKETEETPT